MMPAPRSPIWESRPIEDPEAFVRERIESMYARPLMYAATREAFAVEVWTMLRMLGIYLPTPGFHDFSGPLLLHLAEEPDEGYALFVRNEAIRILDEARPRKTWHERLDT